VTHPELKVTVQLPIISVKKVRIPRFPNPAPKTLKSRTEPPEPNVYPTRCLNKGYHHRGTLSEIELEYPVRFCILRHKITILIPHSTGQRLRTGHGDCGRESRVGQMGAGHCTHSYMSLRTGYHSLTARRTTLKWTAA